MDMTRRLGGALAVLALTGVAAAPVTADPMHDHARGGHHHDWDDDDGEEVKVGSVGGFLLGALIAGGLVAALSAKKKQPTPLPQDVAFVPVAEVNALPPPSAAEEEAATAACAASVEGQGRRSFPVAQVSGVESVAPAGQGFIVRGALRVRQSLREAGEQRGFRCAVDGEVVRSVSVDGLSTAPVF